MSIGYRLANRMPNSCSRCSYIGRRFSAFEIEIIHCFILYEIIVSREEMMAAQKQQQELKQSKSLWQMDIFASA